MSTFETFFTVTVRCRIQLSLAGKGLPALTSSPFTFIAVISIGDEIHDGNALIPMRVSPSLIGKSCLSCPMALTLNSNKLRISTFFFIFSLFQAVLAHLYTSSRHRVNTPLTILHRHDAA